MKQILLVCIHVFSLFSSCSNLKSDNTLVFMPGTYVRSELHEFGQIEDTVTIKLQHSDVHSFVIEQRWKYERVLNGVPQEPEYKVITDQGIYNPKTKLLQNQRNLLHYSFDREKQVVYFGTLSFKKIK